MEPSSGIAEIGQPAAFAWSTSRSEHNQPLRQRGYQRLNDLIDRAERDKFYGTVEPVALYALGVINGGGVMVAM